MQKFDAGAVLTVWTDAEADAEADFNEWYNRQHVNERCDVPGFLSGRRYCAISGRPRYMALYETTGSDVLSSAAYRSVLDNPTDWTRQVMPAFQGLIRAVLDVEARIGRGYGATVASFRPRSGVAASPALAEWLTQDAMPAILAQPGIVGAQLLRSTQNRTATDSTEGQLRSEADSTVEWALFVEGGAPAQVRAACRAVLPPEAFRARGAGTVSRGLYRLVYGNDSQRKEADRPA